MKILKLIFDYNIKHPDSQIPLKENVFLFFIGKLSSLEYIKKLCSYCYSLSLLFEGLININSSKELKDLITIHDIPYITLNDNILGLIEKYEKIKHFFKNNEIIKLWKKYLLFFNKDLNIEKLTNAKNKFILTNKDFYWNIIQEASDYINNLNKKNYVWKLERKRNV